MEEKSNLGKFLEKFLNFCREHDLKPPDFKVSQPIENDEDLKKLQSGAWGYARLGGQKDVSELEHWLAEFEEGSAFRVTSDGMNAISAVLYGLRAVKGPKIILILPLYGGTLAMENLLHKNQY